MMEDETIQDYGLWDYANVLRHTMAVVGFFTIVSIPPPIPIGGLFYDSVHQISRRKKQSPYRRLLR